MKKRRIFYGGVLIGSMATVAYFKWITPTIYLKLTKEYVDLMNTTDRALIYDTRLGDFLLTSLKE